MNLTRFLAGIEGAFRRWRAQIGDLVMRSSG
jgi:hypothetical protein